MELIVLDVATLAIPKSVTFTFPSVEIDFFDEDLRKGDILLLCSDGLSNMVEDEEIEKIIKSGRELPKIAMDLIERANRNGGKDNIAVVLAQPLTGEVEQC